MICWNMSWWRCPADGSRRRRSEVDCMPRAVRSFLSSPPFPGFSSGQVKLALSLGSCIPLSGCFLQVIAALLALTSSLLHRLDRLDEHEPSRHTPTHVHTPPHHITSICHNPGGDPNCFIRCPASSGDDWSIRAVPFRSFPLLLLPCAQRHYYDSFLYYIHRIVCAKTPHCSEYFF